MGAIGCCVLNCVPPPGTKKHRFPKHDVELFETWCRNIGRPELISKGIAQVYKSYRLCDLHFDLDTKFPTFHNRTNLKKGSIPTNILPVVAPLEEVA
ncbi:unnamed protein product, partial [Tenebrio molitor]